MAGCCNLTGVGVCELRSDQAESLAAHAVAHALLLQAGVPSRGAGSTRCLSQMVHGRQRGGWRLAASKGRKKDSSATRACAHAFPSPAQSPGPHLLEGDPQAVPQGAAHAAPAAASCRQLLLNSAADGDLMPERRAHKLWHVQGSGSHSGCPPPPTPPQVAPADALQHARAAGGELQLVVQAAGPPAQQALHQALPGGQAGRLLDRGEAGSRG